MLHYVNKRVVFFCIGSKFGHVERMDDQHCVRRVLREELRKFKADAGHIEITLDG